MMTSRFVIYVLCTLATFGSSLSSAQATCRDEPDVRSELAVMQALLAEVRQLRQDVRHVAAINGRAQLMLRQMELQEQRLTHASAQFNDIRSQIAHVSSQRGDAAKKIESLEARIPQEQDQKVAADQEIMVKVLKESVERLSASEASLRAQEADAANAVQSEQTKWQDLSDRLSALTQGLESNDAIKSK
jgi:chromosome segregation ATPase